MITNRASIPESSVAHTRARVLVSIADSHLKAVLGELAEFMPTLTLDPMTAVARLETVSWRCHLMVLNAQREASYEALDFARDIGWQPRVIFVSMADTNELRLRAAMAQADAFLVLPDDLPSLRSLAADLLE